MTARAPCTNCGVFGPVNMRVADAGTIRKRYVYWCVDHDPGVDTATCENCGLPGHEKTGCVQPPNKVATHSLMGTRTRPMSSSDEAVVAAMWEKKCAYQDHFAHAELIEGVDRPDLGIKIAAGTTVLVTMISRFGDVGIRATSIKDVRHGYSVRVMPDLLHGYRLVAASPERPEQRPPWPEMVIVDPLPKSNRETNRANRKRGRR